MHTQAGFHFAKLIHGFWIRDWVFDHLEPKDSIFIINTVILGLNIWFFRDYLRSKTYSFEYKSIQIRYSKNETLHATWLGFMNDFFLVFFISFLALIILQLIASSITMLTISCKYLHRKESKRSPDSPAFSIRTDLLHHSVDQLQSLWKEITGCSCVLHLEYLFSCRFCLLQFYA